MTASLSGASRIGPAFGAKCTDTPATVGYKSQRCQMADALCVRMDDDKAVIERDNPVLMGVLPKVYARPALDKVRIGQLIDMSSYFRISYKRTQTDPKSKLQ